MPLSAPRQQAPHVHRPPPPPPRRPPSRGSSAASGPVGLPCRPLKLRFDEDAQTSRPSSRSGFIARHIEQPACRHSNPASRNTSCSPSRSAAARTRAEPGTTSAADVRRDAAAAHHPRRLPQVGQPAVRAGADEGHVHPGAGDAAARPRAPCTPARRSTPRAPRHPRPRAPGRARRRRRTAPGLVPQVTIGPSASPSTSSSSS